MTGNVHCDLYKLLSFTHFSCDLTTNAVLIVLAKSFFLLEIRMVSLWYIHAVNFFDKLNML